MEVDRLEKGRLYRSRVKDGEEVDHGESEQIGEDALIKMVWIALTDPIMTYAATPYALVPRWSLETL